MDDKNRFEPCNRFIGDIDDGKRYPYGVYKKSETYSKSEVNELIEHVTVDSYTKAESDDKFATNENVIMLISELDTEKADKSEVNELATDKADKTVTIDLQNQIDSFPKTQEVDEVVNARNSSTGKAYETLKKRIDAENTNLTNDLKEKSLYTTKTDKPNILPFAVKRENTYIPRFNEEGICEFEELEGYVCYEVDVPENKSAMMWLKRPTAMKKGQFIVLSDGNNKKYINVGHNSTPTGSYFKVTADYIGIDFGNLLSRNEYSEVTKILVGYSDEDAQLCYVVGGKTSEAFKDISFAYGKASYPFIGSADFSDGSFSKSSIRNAITDIKLNVFGYTNPYIKGVYWHNVDISFYILVGVNDGTSLCSFEIPATDSGMKTYNSVQSTSFGMPVGEITLDVSKIKQSEITVRNMNTHDYSHFGMLDAVFAFSAEIVPPLRFYSIAGMTNEWYLKNTMYGNPNNYFIRYNESVTAHYNADFDRRRTSVTPSNEAKGGGAVAYYLESMTHEKSQKFNINYLRAAKNGLAEKTIKALFIGDSLIDNGYTCKAINDLFEADESGARIELYGTRSSQGVKHEGHAGWGTYDILHTESYNNISNAFYNPSAGAFDFAYYCNQNSIPELDWIVIQLGVNDIFRPMNDTTTIQNIQAMINSIRSRMPDVKISVATPPQPYLGGKYSCLNFRPAEYAHKFRLDLAKEIISTFGKDVASTQIYVASIHAVTDTDYNYQMSERFVNSESTIKEQYCTDITHYAESAHKQVAKQYYCMFKYIG